VKESQSALHIEFASAKQEINMNDRITMSGQKRTRPTLMGIVAFGATGVLTLVDHFAAHNIPVHLALQIIMGATSLAGIIAIFMNPRMSGFMNLRMSGKSWPANAPLTREALPFRAIYLAFAILFFWSLYSTSKDVKFAQDVAKWFFAAILLRDQSRGSRQQPESA
jgi:hypothetical protein